MSVTCAWMPACMRECVNGGRYVRLQICSRRHHSGLDNPRVPKVDEPAFASLVGAVLVKQPPGILELKQRLLVKKKSKPEAKAGNASFKRTFSRKFKVATR